MILYTRTCMSSRLGRNTMLGMVSWMEALKRGAGPSWPLEEQEEEEVEEEEG